MSQVVDVTKLQALLDDRRPVRLLDVRWRLDRPEGRLDYVDGHLPGAVYVDLERELASPGHPEWGRHPLPAADALERSARRWGVRSGDIVVAYDDNDGVAAARAWWLLRRRGVDIRVLDGGLRAWVAAGLAIETGDVAPLPGDIRVTDADPGVATIEQVAHTTIGDVLLDVRAPQHYRGTAPSADPAQGHIPGAINLPAITFIAPDGRLKSPDEVRRIAAHAGITGASRLIVYCGSGVASSHTVLALEHAGIRARLFPGSWSQWARSAGRPVGRGVPPFETITGTWEPVTDVRRLPRAAARTGS
ncbi:sulfurtransferase [Microbacterium sp. CFBP9034]|uniref:sulfurtransferase n=1 Tax=Microbacterium sp. CFBP9034 TaxID=3096540 RepID=UPI002A6B7544|nr:sulfurtransferase [Microbacterium sp. CFBP9034]MDY0910213.1 sulfurtransferase [Microbacterium sp. CFBP9034]